MTRNPTASHAEWLARRAKYREEFQAMFLAAGYTCFAINETHNRYANFDGYESPPWYTVETPHGFFLLGWRKRVISVEWYGVEVAESFFDEAKEAANTFGYNYIHCWNTDDALKILAAVRTEGIASEASVREGIAAFTASEMKKRFESLLAKIPAELFLPK